MHLFSVICIALAMLFAVGGSPEKRESNEVRQDAALSKEDFGNRAPVKPFKLFTNFTNINDVSQLEVDEFRKNANGGLDEIRALRPVKAIMRRIMNSRGLGDALIRRAIVKWRKEVAELSTGATESSNSTITQILDGSQNSSGTQNPEPGNNVPKELSCFERFLVEFRNIKDRKVVIF